MTPPTAAELEELKQACEEFKRPPMNQERIARAVTFAYNFGDRLIAEIERLRDCEKERDALLVCLHSIKKRVAMPKGIAGRWNKELQGRVDILRKERRKVAAERREQWRNLEAQRDEARAEISALRKQLADRDR